MTHSGEMKILLLIFAIKEANVQTVHLKVSNQSNTEESQITNVKLTYTVIPLLN